MNIIQNNDLVVAHAYTTSFKALKKDMLHLGYTITEESIAYSDNGKPFFIDIPIHFSITNSGDLSFIAYSTENIALDCEIHLDRPLTKLINRYFSENEIKLYNDSPTLHTFYNIWCKKEAMLKYTGIGINYLNMKEIDTTTNPTTITYQDEEYHMPPLITFPDFSEEVSLVVVHHKPLITKFYNKKEV